MHRAPAVSWDVRPTRVRGRALVVLAVCGALTIGAFLMMQPWNGRVVMLLLALLSGTLFAVLVQSKSQRGTLQWDGEQWHWSALQHQVIRQLSCVLDLQRVLLLRLRDASGKTHWLWLQSDASDSRWLALRRAIVSSDGGDNHIAPSS
jgi:hypothetical protein